MTLVVGCYALIFLRLQSQWWFEDDPYLFAIAGQHQRPWDFFLSRDSLSMGLAGVQFTPLQKLTYWIDDQLAPRSALFAYAHTTVSMWLGVLVLFTVLRYWLRPRTAFAVVLLYLLLPSTIVVTEFVSTRNYLDGFLLSLISVWMVQRAISTRGARYVLFIAAAVVFYVLGSLAKQLYLTTTFALIVILCAHRRRWSAVALFCLAGVGYLGYYWWIFGSLKSTFDIPTLSAAEYPEFLLRYPYIFAGGAAGWFLAVVWLAAVGYGMWRRVLRGPELAVAASLVIITVASLHPAAGSLNTTYATPGTWYRVSFVSSSVILFVGAWLLCKLPNPRIVAAVTVCTVVTLAAGAWSTVRTWDAMKRRYSIEGKFYLAYPDRLVYSELPAWWYLVGLDDLYHVAARHYVVAFRPGQPGDQDVISRFSAAWRYSSDHGGRFVYDPELYQRLSVAATPNLPPAGFVDAPGDPVHVTGDPILFQGWAVDDTGLKRVWVGCPQKNGANTELATATRGGERPDISRLFPASPDRMNAAWAIRLFPSQICSDGPSTTLQFFAEDLEGLRTMIGTRTLIRR